MSELLIFIGDVMIGVGITMLVVLGFVWFKLKSLNTRLENHLATMIQGLESQMVGLDVELDNGVYYCYNASDKSFVCQGATALEIREAFQKRFPDKIAFLHNDEDEQTQKLKQELLELKLNEAGNRQ